MLRSDYFPKSRILRWLLLKLTKTKREWLLTRLVRPDFKFSLGFNIKIADQFAERGQAMKLMYKEFLRQGLIPDNKVGIFTDYYLSLPACQIVVAKWRDRVIASLCITRDTSLGLPLERFIKENPIRRSAATKLVEVSGLVMDPRCERFKSKILFLILKFTYEYITKHIGANYIFTAVNERNLEYYQFLFALQPLSKEFVYPLKNNDSYFCFANIDLRKAFQNLIRLSKNDSQKRLFRFFTHSKLAALTLPRSKQSLKMSPGELNYFFQKKSTTWQQISEKQSALLKASYLESEYEAILPKVQGFDITKHFRHSTRYDTKLKGSIVGGVGGRKIQMRVSDISQGGFRAELSSGLRFGTKVSLQLESQEKQKAEVEAWPVWRDNRNNFGFVIAKSSPGWQEILKNAEYGIS